MKFDMSRNKETVPLKIKEVQIQNEKIIEISMKEIFVRKLTYNNFF